MNQYDFGKLQENKLFNLILSKYPTIKQTREKFNRWDYIDEEKKIKIELKSRTIKSNKYGSTILGRNKILEGYMDMDKGYTILYLFNYTDGLFYYKLDKKDEDFKIAFFNDKLHSFIPNKLLKKFNEINI